MACPLVSSSGVLRVEFAASKVAKKPEAEKQNIRFKLAVVEIK